MFSRRIFPRVAGETGGAGRSGIGSGKRRPPRPPPDNTHRRPRSARHQEKNARGSVATTTEGGEPQQERSEPSTPARACGATASRQGASEHRREDAQRHSVEMYQISHIFSGCALDFVSAPQSAAMLACARSTLRLNVRNHRKNRRQPIVKGCAATCLALYNRVTTV